jgi:hypothetical protein
MKHSGSFSGRGENRRSLKYRVPLPASGMVQKSELQVSNINMCSAAEETYLRHGPSEMAMQR